MNEWLLKSLVCPRDKQSLEYAGGQLNCTDGHIYPVFDDIPLLLVDDAETTHGYITKSLEKVRSEQPETAPTVSKNGEIDEFVQGEIPYTSGIMYFSVQHKLTRYPIPETPLPKGHGERLLDIGCNWGRWSIAAARKGYKPVGLDPSLDAVLAARRVSKQLGVETDFVVGDARFLPFAGNAFDTVFSYGVFQHLSKDNVRISLAEASRVLKANGRGMFQMPNKYGIRSYQQRRRRGFTEGEGFEVRYWTPQELLDTFENQFGETKLTADCYLGLGILKSDIDLLPMKYKAVVHASELLKKANKVIKPLKNFADAVWLETINQKQ
ncbi:MAG TPA: methyltransferase domain-containing protein [Pyrinomonadaceae bacterium]|nr:methyltransferase domain-containing protein [Pyrinomonadaceae bacterium]